MPLLILILLLPLVVIALMPLILVQRFRTGTARRLARPWVATLNLVGMLVSAALFLVTAAAMNAFVPSTFLYASTGLGVGFLLGVFGVWISRWEPTPASLHYTPNRWLVLAITLLVTARLVYGFWRGFNTLHLYGDDNTSWLTAFGVAGSVGAGATVVGYYLGYAAELRRRIAKWQRRLLRTM